MNLKTMCLFYVHSIECLNEIRKKEKGFSPGLPFEVWPINLIIKECEDFDAAMDIHKFLSSPCPICKSERFWRRDIIGMNLRHVTGVARGCMQNLSLGRFTDEGGFEISLDDFMVNPEQVFIVNPPIVQEESNVG